MTAKGKPVVFLDRDGVLTKEKSYVCSVEEMEIFSYAAECIQYIKSKGYLAIVITNQSGVARGFFTEKELLKMNRYLQDTTGVDAVYYCPHHPEGSIDQYRKTCQCRKPETGLLMRACEEFDIDMDGSFMVGDRAADILTGQKAGLKTVLLESGYGTARLEEDVTADYIFKDLRGILKIL